MLFVWLLDLIFGRHEAERADDDDDEEEEEFDDDEE